CGRGRAGRPRRGDRRRAGARRAAGATTEPARGGGSHSRARPRRPHRMGPAASSDRGARGRGPHAPTTRRSGVRGHDARGRAAAAQLLSAEEGEAEAARVEHESATEEARLHAELAAAFAAARETSDALHDLTQLVQDMGGDDRAARAAAVGETEAAVALAEAA